MVNLKWLLWIRLGHLASLALYEMIPSKGGSEN